MRPVLLDLFCCEGGAAVGYHQAGFDVIGVDITPQPRYPFPMVIANALAPPFDLGEFDAIHASPPCQSYSVTSSLHDNDHPDLVAPTREMLQASGRPYVIENVQGAPLGNAIRLCGSSFGLGVRRHRLFEVHPMILGIPPCAHHMQPEPIDVTGTGGPTTKARTGGGGVHRKPRNLAHAREVMGIDWMDRHGLSQAIPPAYTKFIGEQLLAHITTKENP